MARTSNPLIGHSRNKIGGVVFSSWKGINTLREKPATVANPRSDAQVAQRSAMSQAVALGRLLLGTLMLSFRQRAVQMSEFNAFVKANVPQAFTKAGAVATFVPANLIASAGTLLGFEDLTFDELVDRVLSYEFSDNSGTAGANASDLVGIVIVSADGKNAYSEITSNTRVSGSTNVTVPGSWSLVGARAALFFLSADHSQASDSQNMPLA